MADTVIKDEQIPPRRDADDGELESSPAEEEESDDLQRQRTGGALRSVSWRFPVVRTLSGWTFSVGNMR